MEDKTHKSPKRGANILSRVKNISPENVLDYVNNVLPKHKMLVVDFQKLCPNWLNNIHQAPEQFGLCYSDKEYIYPRFHRNITFEEAEKYVYGWMRIFPVVNPMSKLTITNDNSLVKTIALYMEQHPYEHDLKTIVQSIVGDEPIVVNDILANALNNYSEMFTVKTIDNKNEEFEINLLPNYKNILINKYMNREEYFHLFDNLVNTSEGKASLQQIYYGAPGTGKSYEVKLLTKGESVVRTTFHPDSDYSTFVGAYKPTTKDVPMRDVTGKIIHENGKEVTENRIIYRFVPQAFLHAYLDAWKLYAKAIENEEEPKPQYLIIEEINRGNCAQIFGDLFQLLDRNKYGFSEYYINADEDIKKFLEGELNSIGLSEDHKSVINCLYNSADEPAKNWIDVVGDVLKGKKLLLPNNLYIWATMNTSDQSLFPIDSAFKRRWDWVYVPIAEGFDKTMYETLSWKIVIDNEAYDWWKFLEKINEQIGATTNSEDKKLGFFFCQADSNGEIDAIKFVGKVLFYLWNDVFKDYGLEGDLFIDTKGKILTYDKFYKTTKGKTEIDVDNVQNFLSKLKLDSEEVDEPDDANGSEKKSHMYDNSKYSINGEGAYNKGATVKKAVEMYISNHPDKTGEEIIHDWMELGIDIPHFIQTEVEYLERTKNDSKRRGNSIEVHEDDVIYVSNQLNPERINNFIEKVNQQDWGIHIEKISN